MVFIEKIEEFRWGARAGEVQKGGPKGGSRREVQKGGPEGRSRREVQKGGPEGGSRREVQKGGPEGRSRREVQVFLSILFTKICLLVAKSEYLHCRD